MPHATWRNLFLIALFLCFIDCYVMGEDYAADPCEFMPGDAGDWFGLPSQVQTCFSSIPFSESVRNSTITIMNHLFQMYSFSDLIQNPFEPYNLQVRNISAPCSSVQR